MASPPARIVVAPINFELEVSMEGARAIVRCCGELDLATSGGLEQRVHALIDRGLLMSRGFEAITLDMRDLDFIDCSGLRVLMQLRLFARERHVSLEIMYSDGPVKRLLDLTSTAHLFERAY